MPGKFNRLALVLGPIAGFVALGAALCAACPAGAAEPENAPEDAWSARWEGPYAGVSLGGIGGGAEIARPGLKDLSTDAGSGAAGIYAGWSMAAWRDGNAGVLVGVEADASLFSLSSKTSDATLGATGVEGNGLGTLRLRAGYAWERVHVFGTAGLALSDLHVKGDDADVSLGLAVGIGGEYAFDGGWTARAEAMLIGLGDEDRTINGTKRDASVGAGLVRVGLARRF